LKPFRGTFFITTLAWAISACGYIGIDLLSTDESNGTITTDISVDCAENFSDALLCTGFETGIPYNTYINSGSVETATDTSHSGSASMHAAAYAQYGYAHARGEFTPLFSGTIYFRTWFFIPSGTLTGLVKLAAFEGWNPLLPDEDSMGAELNIDINVTVGGAVQIYNQTTGSRYMSEGGAVQEGEWFCLSGSMNVSADAGAVVVSIDGNTVLTAENEPTLPLDGVSRMNVGIGWTDDGQNAAELYVDDLVVSLSEVSCL
jgi:hypothetical protein